MPSAACCSFHPKCRVCTSQESLDWSPNSEACRKEDIRSSNVCIELQYDGQFYGQQRVRNMQLGREDFCDSSGLNMLPEKDSGIPINVSSDGIQNKARDSGVKIGSRDRSRRVQFGNREEHDIEEVWDVLQSWQYKAIYRMFFSECSPEELVAYAQQLLRRAEWLNQQEEDLFGATELDHDGDATRKNHVDKDGGFSNDDCMDEPSEAQIHGRVQDINPFGLEFEELPQPLVARADTPLRGTHHITNNNRSKSVGIVSPLPVMSGMVTPMFESPGDFLSSFGSIQMAPLSPTGAMLPSSNNPHPETMSYVIEENASPLHVKESHTNSSIASLMGTMTEMIRRAREGNNA